MIYSRFGSLVHITHRCGLHQPEPGRNLLQLVTCIVDHQESLTPKTVERFFYAETLRADEGWMEITTAINAAPELNLDPASLRAAKKQAL